MLGYNYVRKKKKSYFNKNIKKQIKRTKIYMEYIKSNV